MALDSFTEKRLLQSNKVDLRKRKAYCFFGMHNPQLRIERNRTYGSPRPVNEFMRKSQLIQRGF
jgi:hypothetical protein